MPSGSATGRSAPATVGAAGPSPEGPPLISYPFEAGGALTRVLECGDGDDVVVFLHGSGARADRWLRNLTALAATGRRTLAFDFPGHGLASKRSDHSYDTPSFAEVLGEIVDGLCGGPVTLVGTSLGAHVAAWYACSSPESVRAAILVGPLGLVPVHRDSSQTSSRIADTSTEGVAAKLATLLRDDSLVTPAWVKEERRVNTSPGAGEALARLRSYLAAGVNGDVVGDRYARLRIPTLLVWGSEDRFVDPRYGFEAREVLGGAPLVYLDDAGHAPYIERAEAFNELVAEFLADPAAFPPAVQHR
jgi:2-hydroxy-6-oxonona-2,4-dienedioate hydrolase